MNISDWIARLNEKTSSIRGAYGAAELAAVTGEVSGNVYVYPLSESSGANTRSSRTQLEQLVTERVAVVIIARNLRDGRGENALSDIEELRNDVLGALNGWIPGSGYEMVEHRQGALLSMDGSALWWQDEFETKHYRLGAG